MQCAIGMCSNAQAFQCLNRRSLALRVCTQTTLTSELLCAVCKSKVYAVQRSLRQNSRHCRSVSANNAVKSETKSNTASEDDSAFEKQLKSRRNKQKKTTVQDLQPDTLPTSSKPKSMPANDQLESSIVLVLVSLFVAIIGQGVFLAVSGFLPESWDRFAQDVIYKTFSPTVGIFLASSAGYGVWKSKQGNPK